MNIKFRSDNNIEYTLRSITIAPFRKLTDDEVCSSQQEVWKHSPNCTTRRFNEESTGGEACFCFEVYFANQATIVERCRHFLSKIKATALGYINISTVSIVIVR